MAGVTFSRLATYETPRLPDIFLEPCWYAAYTCANHEKRVAQQLGERNVEHFLPLYETVRRWRDRRVRLQLPLFPCYLFVRVPLRDQIRVLQVSSVVRLVGFGEHPIALAENEIETLRKGLDSRWARPHPYLSRGKRLRVKSGPLTGMEGILLRRKGSFRVVLSIDLIKSSVAVEVDTADLMPSLSVPAPVRND
jgi:transcription antitermination factor NusG